MLQTLNFPAGGRQINAKASFFRYEAAANGGSDESIRVRADGNDLGLFLPGDYVDLPVFASTWEVVPVTASTTGAVRLGVGRVNSSRLTGTVAIVDGERAKVFAGNCYRSLGNQNGGAAAAQVGPYNPAGSGRNVLVQAFRAGLSAADSWNLYRTTTALPTAITSGLNIDPTGPGSIVTIRGDNVGTALAGLQGHGSGYGAASTDFVVVLPRPILLRPGYGMVLSATLGATNVRTTWEWEEWPV